MPGWFRTLLALVLLTAPAAALLHGAPEDQEFREAGAAYEAGRYLEAGDLFTRFARKYPRDPRADAGEFLGATAWIQAGQAQRGLESLRRHARLFPGSSYRESLDYWTGRARFLLKDWEGAAASFRIQAGASGVPDLREQSRYWWGLSLQRLGKNGEAAAVWKESGLESVWGQRSRLLAAQEYLISGNAPEALVLLGRLRQTVLPMDILHGVLLAQTEALARSGDPAAAIQRAEEFLAAFQGDPRELDMRYLRAQALEKRGRVKEAEDDYRLCLGSQDPSLVKRAAFSLGEVYHRTSRWKDSLELWTGLKAEVLSPGEDQKRSGNAALAAYRLRKWDEAASWYIRASRGPERTLAGEALIGASSSAFLGGRKKESLEHLQAYLRGHPGAPRREEAAELLYRAASGAGDPGASLVWLDLLIREFPAAEKMPARRLERSRIRTGREDYAGALEDVQAVLDGKPDKEVLGETLYQGAYIYAQRAEPLRGEKYLFRILEEFPPGELRDRALLARGLAFYNAGQLSPARASLERLIRESPDSVYLPQAWRHLGQVLDRSGRSEESAGAFLEASRLFTGDQRHQALMDSALQRGKTDPEAAQKIWDRMEGETGGITLARVLLYKARGLRDLGKTDQSLAAFRRLLDHSQGLQNPEAGALWEEGALNLAVQLQKNGQDAGALLREWMRRFPQSARRYEGILQVAEGFLKDSRWTEAAETAKELLQNPEAGAWGEVFRLRQASALAEADYESAAPLFREYFRIHGRGASAVGAARSLGAILVRKDKEDELDRWIQEIPELVPAAAVQAEFLLSRSRMILDNRWEEGLKLLQGILRSGATQEQKGEALVLLCEGAVRTGRYALAREWARNLPAALSPQLRGRARLASGQAVLLESGTAGALEDLSLDRTMEEDLRARALHEVWKYYRDRKDPRAADAARRMGELFPRSPWTENLRAPGGG